MKKDSGLRTQDFGLFSGQPTVHGAPRLSFTIFLSLNPTFLHGADSMTTQIDPSFWQAMRWRCIGPSRGGRVIAVAGDPNDVATFYFGAVAGGIWKTTDAGVTWLNVSDGFVKSASVGDLCVSPSDPNVIYAGMGESTIRIDVSHGDGVYKSSDAGHTWRHCGLADTRTIGKVRVHPKNPDRVYVAALAMPLAPTRSGASSARTMGARPGRRSSTSANGRAQWT